MFEKLCRAYSVHLNASAAAKAATSWSAGALAQASTAHLSATPSTACSIVTEAPVSSAAARPKRATPAPASGFGQRFDSYGGEHRRTTRNMRSSNLAQKGGFLNNGKQR